MGLNLVLLDNIALDMAVPRVLHVLQEHMEAHLVCHSVLHVYLAIHWEVSHPAHHAPLIAILGFIFHLLAKPLQILFVLVVQEVAILEHT